MKTVPLCVLCFKMSCSRNKHVRLGGTFCWTCTIAAHVLFATNFVQSGH